MAIAENNSEIFTDFFKIPNPLLPFVPFYIGIFCEVFIYAELIFLKFDLGYLQILLNTNPIIFLAIWIPITFILGLIIEAIATVLNYSIIKKIKILNSFLKYAPSEVYIKKLKVKAQKIAKIKDGTIYSYCTDYLRQNKIENPFELFLAKQIFYLSISFITSIFMILFFIDLLILPSESFDMQILPLIKFSIPVLVFISYGLYKRSKDFEYFSEKTLYSNFIVAKQNPEK